MEGKHRGESARVRAEQLHRSGCSAYRAGAYQAAIQQLREATTLWPQATAPARALAIALLAAGEHEESLQGFQRLANAAPGSVQAGTELGHALAKCGKLGEATRVYREVLDLEPDAQQAHFGLAELLHPGPNYLEVLRALQSHLDPKIYLEIGVETGQTLQLAPHQALAIGVDPAPSVGFPLGPGAQVVEMESDHFFESGCADVLLRQRTIDLGFVDGLHLFEQALRDFINMEERARADSVVLIHDCSPLDAPTAARERQTRFWSGDVWKLIPCLKRYRPDLSLVTLAAAPTGLAVVTGLDPSSQVLWKHYDEIIDHYVPLGFESIEAARTEVLSLMDSDIDAVLRWLDAERGKALKRRSVAC